MPCRAALRRPRPRVALISPSASARFSSSVSAASSDSRYSAASACVAVPAYPDRAASRRSWNWCSVSATSAVTVTSIRAWCIACSLGVQRGRVFAEAGCFDGVAVVAYSPVPPALRGFIPQHNLDQHTLGKCTCRQVGVPAHRVEVALDELLSTARADTLGGVELPELSLDCPHTTPPAMKPAVKVRRSRLITIAHSRRLGHTAGRLRSFAHSSVATIASTNIAFAPRIESTSRGRASCTPASCGARATPYAARAAFPHGQGWPAVPRGS